jgi:predicted outer membrane protein
MSKAKDKQVKDFAQQMITDHSAAQKSVRDLAAKLNVFPEDSQTSNSLKKQAQQTMLKLNRLKGKESDKAYIDNEVAYRERVINATKTVLIPNVRNAKLKKESPARGRATVRRSPAARSAGAVGYRGRREASLEVKVGLLRARNLRTAKLV